MLKTIDRSAGAPPKTYPGPERRHHERLYHRFPVKVQGVDAGNRGFEVEVRMDNISDCGFHACLPVRVTGGAKISATIRFSTVEVSKARPKILSTHGTVRRCADRGDGTCAVYIEFDHHLFL